MVALADVPNPPPGVWTTGIGTVNAVQAIVPLPSARRELRGLAAVAAAVAKRDKADPGIVDSRILITDSTYPYALRQETFNDPSR